MLIVKVWCLPQLEEEQLNELHKDIVRQVMEMIPSLEVRSEDDMAVLFVPDSMKYGLGTEIIVESIIIGRSDPALSTCLNLCMKQVIKSRFPSSKVLCFTVSHVVGSIRG